MVLPLSNTRQGFKLQLGTNQLGPFAFETNATVTAWDILDFMATLPE